MNDNREDVNLHRYKIRNQGSQGSGTAMLDAVGDPQFGVGMRFPDLAALGQCRLPGTLILTPGPFFVVP